VHAEVILWRLVTAISVKYYKTFKTSYVYNKASQSTEAAWVLAMVDCVWNVMAHAQKPDFVFRRNGRDYLNRPGASVQSTTGSRGVRISGSNAGYNMFRGSVKSTGYPLHSPVSHSLPLLCVTVCHHILIGLYQTLTSTRAVRFFFLNQKQSTVKA